MFLSEKVSLNKRGKVIEELLLWKSVPRKSAFSHCISVSLYSSPSPHAAFVFLCSLLFPEENSDNKIFYFHMALQMIFVYLTRPQHRKQSFAHCLTAYICFMINVFVIHGTEIGRSKSSVNRQQHCKQGERVAGVSHMDVTQKHMALCHKGLYVLSTFSCTARQYRCELCSESMSMAQDLGGAVSSR